MKVLVANLGSTSFKYRLFEMVEGSEGLLAKGGYERVTDFGEAIREGLAEMEGLLLAYTVGGQNRSYEVLG